MNNQTVPSASEAGATKPNDQGGMVDIPPSPDAKITVERRGQIVLIGINRPQMFNHIDPETFYGLAKAYYDFDNDDTLQAAVLCGHGEHFSRGNDVDAFSALAKSGKSFKLGVGQLDPLGRAQKLSKPLVAVATVTPGTWVMNSNSSPIFVSRVRTSTTARPKMRTAASQASHRSAGPGRSAGQMPCDTCSPGILGTRRR